MLNPQKNYSYEKLIVYQKAKKLVIYIYRVTSDYPKTELYTLVPQMRRSAISLLANIVEGYAKESSAEYSRFLTIAIGYLTELEVYLDISLELKFLSETEFNKLETLLIETKRLLYGSRKAARVRVTKS